MPAARKPTQAQSPRPIAPALARRLYRLDAGALRALIERARQGSANAAHMLMAYFVARVHAAGDDEPAHIDAGVLQYFADAFERYFEGRDTVASAIGVRARRGRAALNAMKSHVVREFYASELRRGKRGAVDRTAAGLGVDRERVRHLVLNKRKSDADSQ